MSLLPVKCVAKKTIVYAPHHSLGNNSHRMSTWKLMGEPILDFAKKK